MADNVVLNPGSAGDTIAADDVGGIKYQVVKLAKGADGVNDGYIASDNPLPVSTLGFPKTIKVDVTRPADTTAYGAGEAISDSTSAPTSGGFTIPNAARQSGGSAILMDVCVASPADPVTRLGGEIWLFDQAVTNPVDNGNFVVSDSEIKNCIGVVPFSLYDAGNNNFAHVSGLNILCTCVGSTDLRFLIRTRNAYTPVSAEVFSFAFKFMQVD